MGRTKTKKVLITKLNSNEIDNILKQLKSNENLEFVRSILTRIKILPDSGCWTIRDDWSEYATVNGIVMHRFMYAEFISDIIQGYYICHHCDKKGCINYNHLFQGTPSNNSRDWRRKYTMFIKARPYLKDMSIVSWNQTAATVESLISDGLIKDNFIVRKLRST